MTATIAAAIPRQARAPSSTTAAALSEESKTTSTAAPAPTVDSEQYISAYWMSALTFYSCLAAILGACFYTGPYFGKEMYKVWRFRRTQREKAALLAETRAHRAQVVELLTLNLGEKKLMRADITSLKEVMVANLEEKKRMRETMEQMGETMRVGFEAVDTRNQGIEYRTDWILEFHQDENERFRTLKDILPGLTDEEENMVPYCWPPEHWDMGDGVEEQVVEEEGGWGPLDTSTDYDEKAKKEQ